MRHKAEYMIAGLLSGIRPEPRMTVTEWADSRRVLSEKATAMPGPWRTSFVPYLREIMDALSPHSGVEEVVFCKGSQIGASEMGYNVIGFYIDNAPCPILILNPTEEVMTKNSEMRIAPMFEDTPSLKAKLAPARSRSADNRKLFKSGPGWVLAMAGTNTPNSVSSMACRVLILDEVDRMPKSVGSEGSPIALARTRTNTFGARKKVFILSTPTDKTSTIMSEYLTTDQRRYFVPCPHCEHYQTLEWENLRWHKVGADYRASMFCTECGAEIEEHHKTDMLARGMFIPTAPQNTRTTRRGYHVSSLYSPIGWLSLAQIAEKYDEAYNVKNDAQLKQVFQNTILGRVYEEELERTPWEEIRARAGGYQRNALPEDGPLFITAGADVQHDRIEVEVVAWGLGKRSWSVDYRVYPGETANPQAQCWKNLETLLDERWMCSGVEMPVAYMGIDSSDQTRIVYDVVNGMNNRGRRVLPLKGVNAQLAAIKMGQGLNVDALGKKKGRPIWLVGVNTLKDEVMGFLRSPLNNDGSTPPGWCAFPAGYPDEYFKGLLSEVKVVATDQKGQDRIEWRKIFKRNEPLDCRNYARAAAQFGDMIDYDPRRMAALRGSLARVVEPKSEAPKEKKPRTRKEDGGIWGNSGDVWGGR